MGEMLLFSISKIFQCHFTMSFGLLCGCGSTFLVEVAPNIVGSEFILASTVSASPENQYALL